MKPFAGLAIFFRALSAVALVSLAACAAWIPSEERIGSPTPLQSAPLRTNAVIPAERKGPLVYELRGSPVSQPTTSQRDDLPAEAGDVVLNFVDTDIREIVRVILGESLKVNYTIDPAIQGTASLEIAQPLPRSRLIPTLETLLNQNGATLVRRNGVYRVTSLATGATSGIVAGAAAGSGSQVIALKYVSAKDLAKVLEPYVNEGGKIIPDSGSNALLVSGNAAVRQSLIDLIRVFDIDALAGQSYAIFPAGDTSAEKLATEIEKAFRLSEDRLAGLVRVVPMQRVNAVLVVTQQPRYIEDARRFLSLRRKVESATARAWHFYYVQNGQTADLATLLQQAFTPGSVTAATAATAEPGATAPGAESARLTSPGRGAGGSESTADGSRSSGGATLGQTTGGGASSQSRSAGTGTLGGLDSGTAQTLAAVPDLANLGNQALSALSGPVGAETSTGIRILPTKRDNALLIYATASEYAAIEGMLRKLDILPLQVLIEATIAEVTLNDALAYGTQFFLGGSKIKGVLSFGDQIPDTTTFPPGAVGTVAGHAAGFANNLPGFVLANGAREVLNALSAVTQVKVLSAPEVMVLDDQPARLQVGSRVPVQVQTQQSTLTSNAPIVNSIEYRDTGVIMLVTPRINSGGLVTLNVAQEVSDVASVSSGNINSPTFNQRVVRTRVVAQDGQTVGMAGLIRDNDFQQNQGIPILKEIPLVGSLFSSQANSRTRTELLVLITPHVIRDQREARAMTDDLRKQLINADFVAESLRGQRVSGSPNPNRLP